MTLGDKFLPRGCLELPVDPETSAAKVFFQRPEEYFPKNRRRNSPTSLPASQVGDICSEGLFAGAVIFGCSLPAPLELTHLCRKASSLLPGRVWFPSTTYFPPGVCIQGFPPSHRASSLRAWLLVFTKSNLS